MKRFRTKKQLDKMIQLCRQEAIARAKSTDIPFIRSRGTWLCTSNEKGEQCQPSPKTEGNIWDKTMGQINQLIFRIEQDYPNVDTVYLRGEYKGAHTLTAMKDDNWLLVGDWNLDVWNKET